MATSTTPVPSAAIVAIDDTKFANDVLSADSGLCLVAFGAAWCGPCKQLKPNLESVATKYADHLTVFSYDVDKSHTYAERYSVRGIPSILLFDHGNHLAGLNGYNSIQKIEQLISSYLPKQSN